MKIKNKISKRKKQQLRKLFVSFFVRELGIPQSLLAFILNVSRQRIFQMVRNPRLDFKTAERYKLYELKDLIDLERFKKLIKEIDLLRKSDL